MLFADGHDLDMALLGGNVMHHYRFALGADHGDGVAGLERLSLVGSADVGEHDQVLAAFHRFHPLLRVECSGKPCRQCQGAGYAGAKNAFGERVLLFHICFLSFWFAAVVATVFL
jgi:hypothetical protein